MTVAQAKQRIYTLATGESDTPDTDMQATMLAYMNIMQDRWTREPGVDWNSLRELVDAGTITATNSYTLDGVVKVSRQEGDYVVIEQATGEKFYYSLVSAQRLQTTSSPNTCAYFGGNLVFNRAFTATDREFGGTINVPAYVSLDPLTRDNDQILVDDPDWVVYMVASELMAHDVTKSDQSSRMLQYANDSMTAMKESNESQVDEVLRGWSAMGHITDDYSD